MEEINLLDLLLSDTFRSVQRYLSLKDIFSLRCVSSHFRDYFNHELRHLKQLSLPNHPETVIDTFKCLTFLSCNLEEINLSKNDWLNDDLLLDLLQSNTESLTSLNLSNCQNLNLTPVALQPVIIHCKKIKKLHLRNCSWLTQGCLEAIAFHLESLEELDLSNCAIMSERCLIILLSKFHKLKVLSLASVSNVCDNVLFTISRCLKEIVHLNLFGCHLITDRGVGALSLNCRKLETLSIRGCHLITERSLNLLRARNVHIDVPKRITTQLLDQQMADRQNIIYLQV